MALVYNQLNKSISDITGSTGWYGVRAAGRTIPVYVDQDYDGGGWVCVMANRAQTGGMNNLKYTEAVNECHFRTEPSSNNSTNTKLGGPKNGVTSLADVNIWVGLKFWADLAGRATTNKITVVQFVATSNGTALSGTHTKRWRWQFDSFSSTYAFQNASSIGGEGGTGDAPGMYSYHAVNGYNLTTYNYDQDVNSGNCATYYNNNPFWYGSCWSGNYFGGGASYLDKPYWVSSGADHHQYGAVYIK